MKTCARLLLLAFCALFLAPAQAGEANLKIYYAGTVFNMVDPLNFGDTIIISDADARGSFGAMQTRVVSKFIPMMPIPDPEVSCNMPDKVPFVMDYARSVTTFKDHSEMFIVWDSGWLCGTPGYPGAAPYEGFVKGNIVGGTGRFEGATGEVESEFGGFDLTGPFVIGGPEFPSFGSWKGTVTGAVVFGD
jgi:hypothetical protein